jgi:diketogulonate reductase-like aldo/keto reductase
LINVALYIKLNFILKFSKNMEFKELGKTKEKVAVIGQGTWRMGGGFEKDESRDEDEVKALRRGIELEMTFIDTAEIYGSGHAEEIVGKAIKGLRDKVFIATKVSSEHLRYDDVIKAAEGSLRRLNISTIDLYQIHWPNPRIPIKETMSAMEHLIKKGKIRYVGVSNFSVKEMKEAIEALSVTELVSNQVRYSLLARDIENDILPFCQKERITVIAYSPLAKGAIASSIYFNLLNKLAKKYDKTPAQIALNWLIEKDCVIAIPKASRIEHVEENAKAVGWRMSKEDYNLLSSI